MWQNKKPLFLILPAFLTTFFLFFGGLWQGVLQSLGWNTILKEGPITIKNYGEVLLSEDFYHSLGFTLGISISSTIFSALIAMVVIFSLFMLRSRGSRMDRVFQRFFQIPMLFPYIVAAYIVFLLFSSSGWLARILYHLRLIDNMAQFPILVHDPFGWGIILSYVWKTSPFMVMMLYPILLKVEKSWLEVGRVLGAKRGEFFREVVFPMLIGPLKMVSFIVFSYSFLDYEIPYLLGVTYPKALSVASYQLYMNGSLGERPMAMAMNILSILLVALFGFLFYYFTGTKKRRERQSK